MNILQHQAAAAIAAIDDAKTPLQRHEAQRQGLAVHADLEKQLGDANAMAAFMAAKPKSMVGVYKDDTVRDHPIFMVGPAGTKITGSVTLPDGSKAAPNPQYQIVVPAHLVPAMIARGFKRANDVLTDRHTDIRDPAIPNGTAA
jgi:hypothetical protein